MAFEIVERDLLARIGRLKTKSGSFETPALLPVINTRVQRIPPTEIYNNFGYKAVITNAYLLKKHFEDELLKLDVHQFLNFPGIIMTDSGAYQILRYGRVNVGPIEIANFQEKINTDIAVILDVPTGWKASRSYAEWTVNETIERASKTMESRQRKNILWVGPIQGGKYLDLVVYSAKKMSKFPFDIYALGSPTEVMEHYLFGTLLDMAMSAKVNLPPEKPLHLFGAGHPFMFSFVVALGYDLFDSASYAIYARENRYITEYGTIKLKDLNYFPCSCSVCKKYTPDIMREMIKVEREKLLAEHNLNICMAEILRIKQAIHEGRLWELLEIRSRSHPSLLSAFKKFKKYQDYIERYSPSTKHHGIFIYGSTSLNRPEIVRYRRKILSDYEKPERKKILLLLPYIKAKPLYAIQQYSKVKKIVADFKDKSKLVHICMYTVPFGIIPPEIYDTYPLSQFETSKPFCKETVEYAINIILQYVKLNDYSQVILHPDYSVLDEWIIEKMKQKIKLKLTTNLKETWSEKALKELRLTLQKIFRTKSN
jgi:7-cyano-7-deazaguanine tRNA-ribosyltransferase